MHPRKFGDSEGAKNTGTMIKTVKDVIGAKTKLADIKKLKVVSKAQKEITIEKSDQGGFNILISLDTENISLEELQKFQNQLLAAFKSGLVQRSTEILASIMTSRAGNKVQSKK